MKIFTSAFVIAAATIGLLAAGAAPAASTPTDSASVPPAPVAAKAVTPPAAAAGIVPSSIRYESKLYNGPLNGTVLATVGCPAGTFVVSAGVAHGTPLSLAPLRSPRSSQRIANFTGVGGNIHLNVDDGVPGGTTFAQITAGCAPSSQLAGGVSRSLVIGPGLPGLRTGTATCPNGMRAFGGGAHYVTSNGHFSTTASSMGTNRPTADGTGWTYSGFSGFSGFTTDTLVIDTQCLPLTGSYIEATNVVQSFGDVLAFCKPGFSALSGGWSEAEVRYSMSGLDYWYATASPGQKATVAVQCVVGNSF